MTPAYPPLHTGWTQDGTPYTNVCVHAHRCAECGAIYEDAVVECDWDEDHDQGICAGCLMEAAGPDILEMYKIREDW